LAAAHHQLEVLFEIEIGTGPGSRRLGRLRRNVLWFVKRENPLHHTCFIGRDCDFP